MKKKYLFLLLVPFILVAACSDKEETSDPASPDRPGNEHFLKDKTQALEKARQVEQMLKVETGKQRKAIESQTQ